MSNHFKTYLTIFCVLIICSIADAQGRAKSKRAISSGPTEVTSLEEPDFTRFRVVTGEGILVVFDADDDWGERDEPYSQLAYWHDFASKQLFFFDQLLFAPDDVLQSVAAMERDLAIDPALLSAEKPELSPLPDITSPGQWRPAVEAAILAVMAGGQAASPEGGVSGVDQNCVPNDECDAAAAAASGPLAAPLRGTSSTELYAMALGSTKCDCDGGGSPPPAPCTSCSCDPDCCEANNRCCGNTDCCGDSDPCCDQSSPCCVNPDRCCHPDNPCCGSSDPCCDEDDECCGDTNRCCNTDNPCCQVPDPCCDETDPCCGNSNRCCNDDNPCCNSCDPCCNQNDSCCGDSDRCCNADNPCCHSPDPCCNKADPCCKSSDRCCNDDNPCCHHQDPCCNLNDPCCGSSDECCNPDSPCCGTGEGPCCDSTDPCCNDPECDTDGDGYPDAIDPDVDGDGLLNFEDPDIDGDGLENGEDPNVDGDGKDNGDDPDVDGDGQENGEDPDVDGDGQSNGEDDDVDGDGESNGNDEDVDGDDQPNGGDVNIDGDETANGQDTDIDGDGVPNAGDGDTDGDGIPNEGDTDVDGDGVGNDEDPAPVGCEGTCCDSVDPCCGVPDPCCGSSDPCCGLDEEAPCNDGDPCTENDACYSGVCTGSACAACCNGVCCAIGEQCCGDACCTEEDCCDEETCCSDEGQAAGATCCAEPCDPPDCNDDNVCTKDKCVSGECKHPSRVNLTISGLAENLEDQLPGKIMCSGGVVPTITVSLDLARIASGDRGSAVLEVLGGSGKIVGVYDGNTQLQLPLTFQPSTDTFSRSYSIKALGTGSVTLQLTWTSQPLGANCSDSVALTVRPLWTSDLFPQTTLTPSNTQPQVAPGTPEPGTVGNNVGFGIVGANAITWNPDVTIQVSGNHVACNQFTIGVVQNLRSTNVTYTYSDGSLARTALFPSLDADGQSAVPFYTASSLKTMTECGNSGALTFVDRPGESDAWTNPCPGRNGPLQSISYQKQFETWLVARHNPSGCFTVLKHFTWGQAAQTTNLQNPSQWTRSTTNSGVDNGPGGMPVLTPPFSNGTARRVCP